MTALVMLLGSDARAALPVRARIIISLLAVAAIHIVAISLLVSAGPAMAGLCGFAALAYGRGLFHALDFDHVSMIDNSIRKFVAEGHRPVSVGLAFSSGHSAVVIISSALVVAGVSAMAPALDGQSPLARTFGAIGLAVSGIYLLLCAAVNVPRFLEALRLRRCAHASDLTEPGAPRVAWTLVARLFAWPLRWVRHPRHIFGLGFAFSLGFDTSSQIGLLVLIASGTLAGVPWLALMAVPLFFTAGITLVDTLNGMFMLRLYATTAGNLRRHLTWNLVITGIGIVSAAVVAGLAISELAALSGLEVTSLTNVVDTEFAGFGLVALFLAIGIFVALHLRSAPEAGRVS